MAEFYNFSEVEILAFSLVLIRISTFMTTWPVFGGAIVPAPAKILFSLALSIMIFPTIDWKTVGMTTSLQSSELIWMVMKEAFIGVCFGYLSRVFFYALNIAGDMISVSMGISSAQLFNPSLDERSSAVDQFISAIGVLFFLTVGGHHFLLSGVVDSFQFLPPSQDTLSLLAFKGMGAILQETVLIGFKLSAPVVISVMFMNVAMAVIGRAVPQINVLITSLPVNILVGFLILIFSLPLMMMQLPGLLETSTDHVFNILKSF